MKNQIYLTAKPKGKRTAKFANSFFTLDTVFPPTTSNEQVFDSVGNRMLRGVMKGYHGCIFAYGQTSSGKTYTIHGVPSSPGIVPQAVQYIFDYIEDHPNKEFVLRVSYVEIYNEIINDLLNPSATRLKIRENREKGVYVQGLKEEIVMSAQQVLALIAAGESHRHIGRTNYNAVSSRSHTLFRLIIESSAIEQRRGKKKKGARILTSTLNIVDLAGSENAVKAGSAKRIKETGYINKSLLTLGHVIFKLAEKSRGHIPYRDSKLTRILQNSLSGRAFISIVCCLSPSTGNIEESIQTLKFAARAKKIKNVVSVNEKLDQATLLEKYREEIEKLKRTLAEVKSAETDRKRLQAMEEEREEYKQRISQLERIILTSSKTRTSATAEQRDSEGGGDSTSGRRPSGSRSRRASIAARLKRAKSYTMPKTFFMAAAADAETDQDYAVSEASLGSHNSADTSGLEIKPQFETAEGMRQASADFANLQRTVEDLKQRLQEKDTIIARIMEDNKRLIADVEKRDMALREWEAFYQAESNKLELQEESEAEAKEPPRTKRTAAEDILSTTDAEFNSPLVEY